MLRARPTGWIAAAGLLLTLLGLAGGGSAAAAGAGHATPAFSVSGSTSGLYPGRSRSLVLTVTNPQKAAITVTSITTTVGAPSSACAAANVKVTSFVGKLVVAAGATAKATVTVTMAHSAPNACQGKVFPFHYSGVATEA